MSSQLQVLPSNEDVEHNKKQLLDRIDDLLKKINFNKELIASYDKFYESQSCMTAELRAELGNNSLLSDGALSETGSLPTLDYQTIFDQSEKPPNCDVPPSTQISEEFIVSKNKKFQEMSMSNTDLELVTYLVDREREILKLHHCCVTNDNHNFIETTSSFKETGEKYIKRYWDLWEQHKKLKHLLSEIQAKEQSLVDQLHEQTQLTVFYAYLNHSSSKLAKNTDLTEDSFSDTDE